MPENNTDIAMLIGLFSMILRMIFTDVIKPMLHRDKANPVEEKADVAHRKIDSAVRRVSELEKTSSEHAIRLGAVEKHHDSIADKIDRMSDLIAQLNTNVEVLASQRKEK